MYNLIILLLFAESVQYQKHVCSKTLCKKYNLLTPNLLAHWEHDLLTPCNLPTPNLLTHREHDLPTPCECNLPTPNLLACLQWTARCCARRSVCRQGWEHTEHTSECNLLTPRCGCDPLSPTYLHQEYTTNTNESQCAVWVWTLVPFVCVSICIHVYLLLQRNKDTWVQPWLL